MKTKPVARVGKVDSSMRERVKFLLDKLADLLRFQKPGTADRALNIAKTEEQSSRFLN
ncbi:MAG: hypothetical protein GQF41_4283 [Candidatus Rifleibacterium amylolyticum]|nr:MAG: hypothetical protein GQF41_4283 [Candidatus Rifleibacterium amylolyticum]